MDRLIDANGHATSWKYDLQGRVLQEFRAGGGVPTTYTYETTTSRLKTVTEPMGQILTYAYSLDDRVLQITHGGTAPAVTAVSYSYESAYPRLATTTDGTGLTTYAYGAAGTSAAGRVTSIDGPLANDTIIYTYDATGQIATETVGSVTRTFTYDDMGRMTTEVNALGTFTYTYSGASPRIASLTYPNGQQTVYTYLGNTDDRRLGSIRHRDSGGATLSLFEYTYDRVGNVATWYQQAGHGTPSLWRFAYDLADQLVAATKYDTQTPANVLAYFTYAYDAAGNRLSEQVGDVVRGAAFDASNRRVSEGATGTVLRVAGTLSEPATVTVQGIPVQTMGGTQFLGTAGVVPGTNTLTLGAADASGNSTVSTYEVDVTSPSRTFSYDANGRLTSDGTRTLTWNAGDSLTAVSTAAYETQFYYRADGHVARIKDTVGGTVVADRDFIWCGAQVCQERDRNTGSVIRMLTPYGELAGSVKSYYTRDHLGSVRDVWNDSGASIATYGYDPFGRSEIVYGTRDDREFGGLLNHGLSGVALAQYRAYDPSLGTWLSKDPIGLSGGLNLYAYVEGNPLRSIDPAGLVGWDVQEEPIEHIVMTNEEMKKACGAVVCGCTKPTARAPWDCQDTGCGKFKLTLSIYYRAHIYINRDAYTPEWLIRRHERGHVSDDISALREGRRRGEPLEAVTYESDAQCQRTGRAWNQSILLRMSQNMSNRHLTSPLWWFCY